jgi:hypothetical protein
VRGGEDRKGRRVLGTRDPPLPERRSLHRGIFRGRSLKQGVGCGRGRGGALLVLAGRNKRGVGCKLCLVFLASANGGQKGTCHETVSAQTEVLRWTGGLVMQGSSQPRSTNKGAGTAVTSWHALRVSRRSETNSPDDLRAKVIQGHLLGFPMFSII